MLKQIQLILLALLFVPTTVFAQTTVTGQITTDTFWTADTEYVLDGAVFVTNGASLYIEAGTVIKAEDGQDVNATALVITRGSKIFAEGTASKPIVFTSINDNGTLDKDDTGEWGGVVILGKASTNNASEKLIEGLDQIETDPALVGYGGTDDMDNSGVMRYVSIRHTGINVGQDSGNEIQGLTLGAVGAGTTIEFIESFASADDGYEFFGGTVNTKYMISAFVEDDGFDWDQGFRGKGQFW
ncbi:MAG: T9SS C-terminal target domain-containing protein, partial [Balneola sp.]